MKKALIVSLVLVTAFFTFGSVNKAYAQSETPVVGSTANYGLGGRGGMLGGNQQGLLHDEMVEVVAEKLGISVDDLNTRITNGENLYSVAIAEGLSNDEAKALLVDARSLAIDLAVTNGDLTQAQADLMKTRSSMMGTGPRGTYGGTGMMNGNRGANGTGTCVGTYTTN